MFKRYFPNFTLIASIALPVSLQTMLQSSFGIIDEVMIGQLGETVIASVGVVVRCLSLFGMLVSAVCVIAGIMISQYLGSAKSDESVRALNINLVICLLGGIIYTAVCFLCPKLVFSFFTNDEDVILHGVSYLRITSVSTIPMAISMCMAVMLRCDGMAVHILSAGIICALLNTALNYVLIFGFASVAPMYETGAAIATVISSVVMLALTIILVRVYLRRRQIEYVFDLMPKSLSYLSYLYMLAPVIVNEGLWCVGESIFASVYAHVSTAGFAAISLIAPFTALILAAFSGISQSSAIVTGRALGENCPDKAYALALESLRLGLILSLVLMALLALCAPYLMRIYNVEESTRYLGVTLLMIFSLLLPFKILNYIGGAGIIRAGGDTRTALVIGTACTYLIAVPAALATAFYFKLEIQWVFLITGLEEIIRFAAIYCVIRKKRWMRRI